MAQAGAGARGEEASRPWEISKRGWKEVILRVKDQVGTDNLSIVSAGVAFFTLLAIFPGITALVTLYGLVTDAGQVEQQLSPLRDLLPSNAFDIIAQQTRLVASKAGGSLSLGLALSLMLAIWSANAGTKSIITALNIAYEEQEKRGFFSLNLWSLTFTIVGILFMIVALAVIAAVPAALAVFGSADGPLQSVLLALRWLVMAALMILALALLYRYAPSRTSARMQWVSAGAIAATVLWLLASVGFSLYVRHFGSYDKTFGSLGAVVILPVDVVLHLDLCGMPGGGAERRARTADPQGLDGRPGKADRQARRIRRRQQSRLTSGGTWMNSIFWLIGVIVVILAVLSLLGLRCRHLMGRVLAGIVATLLAVLAALIGLMVAAVAVVLVVYDKDDIKNLANEGMSKSIGRTFAIRGDADLDPGWVTRLHLGDVMLANAPWGETPNMVQVDGIDVAVDVRALLKGKIVLPELTITRPNVLLEKNAKREANWQLSTRAGGADNAAGPESRPEIPVIRKLSVEGGRFVFKDPAAERVARLNLANLQVTDDRPDRQVHITGDGRLDQGPFKVRATAGPWETLIAQQPYPIDLDATLNDVRAKIAGTIDEPAKAQGLKLRIDVSGDNTANLYGLTGIALPPSPPYRLSGDIDRQGSEFRIANANGKLGDSDVRGTMAVDMGGERLRLKADITSDRLVFADLAPFVGARPGGQEGEAQKDAGTPIAKGGKLLPDKQIDLTRLNAMDADLVFNAKRIDAPTLPIDSLSTKLSLNAGTLKIEPADIGIGMGRVSTVMTLYGAQKPVKVDIDTRLERLDLKRLFRGKPFIEQTAGTLGGRAKLSATGTSIAQILGSADGEVLTVMSGGQISHLLIEAMGLDIAEAIGYAVSGDKPIPIRCIVTDFGAERGVFTSKTFVIDTTDTNVAGKGAINMREEKIDLTLYPPSKDWSPLSLRAPFTSRGRSPNPRLSLIRPRSASIRR